MNKVANFKPFWWLAAAMGQNNLYAGKVFEYQPVFGSGAAVIGLTPSDKAARDLEFDENDPDNYVGERGVLGLIEPGSQGERGSESESESEESNEPSV